MVPYNLGYKHSFYHICSKNVLHAKQIRTYASAFFFSFIFQRWVLKYLSFATGDEPIYMRIWRWVFFSKYLKKSLKMVECLIFSGLFFFSIRSRLNMKFSFSFFDFYAIIVYMRLFYILSSIMQAK